MGSDLRALEQLLSLSGYDMTSLLSGNTQQLASGSTASPQHLQQLTYEAERAAVDFSSRSLPLQPQQQHGGLEWATQQQDTAHLMQEVAQSLAASLEQQRNQQQMVNAVQHLRLLQQQQELAALQQQLSGLGVNPVSGSMFAAGSQLEQAAAQLQQEAAYHALQPELECVNFPPQRSISSSLQLQRLINHHNAVQRSYSSESIQPRTAQEKATGFYQRPGGVMTRNGGPNPYQRTPRGPNRRGPIAKAPSWAGSDWHPLKSVLVSGQGAAAGTGVFLPHRAESSSATTTPASADCSVNGSVDEFTCSEAWSRSSTADMEAAPPVAPASHTSTLCDVERAIIEEAAVPADECDFAPLAQELADLMAEQAISK